jgi:hypothetical protein
MHLRSLACAFLTAGLSACSSSPAADAPPDGGTEAQSTTGGDASALVAQCQALAATFAQHCHDEYTGDALTPDTERVCIWNAYGQLCATGNTQLLVDSMNCFGQNPSCWTFSDSNSAATCLAAVHAAGETAATRSFFEQLCANCGGTGCDGGDNAGQAELVPYLLDDTLSALGSCLGTQCPTADAGFSCPAVPDYAAIFDCK